MTGRRTRWSEITHVTGSEMALQHSGIPGIFLSP